MTPATVRFTPLALLVLAVAACVPAPAPTTPPPVVVAPPPPAPPPPPIITVQTPQVQPDWTTATITPGDWNWRMSEANSVTEFHAPQGHVSAAIACLAAQRQVMIGIAGGRAGTMTVRTESVTRSLQSQISGPFNRVLVAADDPLLDAIAFSRGHFAVEVDGAGYYLPSYPEITRVIADCR